MVWNPVGNLRGPGAEPPYVTRARACLAAPHDFGVWGRDPVSVESLRLFLHHGWLSAADVANFNVLATLTSFALPFNLMLESAQSLATMAANPAAWAAMKDVQIRAPISTPAMTGFTAPSGKVTASSTNGNYHAWYAFDGRADWLWLPNVADAGQWLGYEFAAPVFIHTCELTPGGLGGPTSWVLEYSDNGIAWNAALYVPSYTPVSGQKTAHQVIAPGYHKYWRLFMLGATGFGSIDELQLRGFV